MFVFHRNTLQNPKIIINFPTKRHWRGDARIEDIESGLQDLVRVIQSEQIKSIAIPPLVCGFGGLNWRDVYPRIERALGTAEIGSGNAVCSCWNTRTRGDEGCHDSTAHDRRACSNSGVDEAICGPRYRLTLLEIQKLAYFLEEAGESLRLKFVKQKYGPYAEELHFVLQRLEGHFLRGYGDRSRSVSVKLMPGALDESEKYLRDDPNSQGNLRRVAKLIRGFETPYGMELLATVHWVAQHEDPAAREDVERAVAGVQNWSPYKRQTFLPRHIEQAWRRLKNENWFESPRR